MGTEAAFDAVVDSVDQPAFLVTTRHGDTLAGCLIGFGGRVSIDPRRFLACLSEKNRTYRVAARGARHLAVHLLPAQRRDLAELFGGESGDDTDKFSRCEWREGPHGMPLVDGCPDWFVGRVVQRIVLGDHVGFLLEPVVAHRGGSEPLRVGELLDIDPGHEA